jgi:RNA polymerase sigma factor (sigma-70 family)
MCPAPLVEDDAALLDLYCRTRSTEAFTALVERHIGWVSAVARRKVKDRHLAEDVTQAVFIILARKAGTISRDTPLSAWLFRVARFAANDALKQESRRRVRLNRAAAARASSQSQRRSAELDLDQAIACLPDADRQAVFLRFYEDKSMAEIGVMLGINEVAAKKRVSRALRRLRELMARRGIPTLSVAMLALLLLRGTRAARAASAEALHAVVRNAAGMGSASAFSLHLADATINRLAGAHSRLLAALAGASLVLVLAVSSFAPVMGQVVYPLVRSVTSLFAPDDGMTEVPPILDPAPDQPPPVTRAWAGRTGSALRPIFPAGGGDWPIHIHSPSGNDSPVVIVQDPQGRLWYRSVDSDDLPAISAAPGRDEYDELNPYATTDTRHALNEFITREGTAFRDADASGSGAWRLIDGVGEDGSIVLPEFQLESEYVVENFANDPMTGEQAVPEACGVAVWAGLAGAFGLLRRRSRRIHSSSR